MEIKPINTHADHAASLLEIERLWNAEEGTADGNRLEILMALVEAYEETHFPIDMQQPIKALRIRPE